MPYPYGRSNIKIHFFAILIADSDSSKKVSTQTSLLFFKFLWDHCQKRQNSLKIGLIKLIFIFHVIGIFDNVPIRIFNKED